MRLRSATWLRDEVEAFPDWVVGVDATRSVGKSRNQATQQPWWMHLPDGHGLVDRLTKADHPETVDLSLCRGGCKCKCTRVCGWWCKSGLRVWVRLSQSWAPELLPNQPELGECGLTSGPQQSRQLTFNSAAQIQNPGLFSMGYFSLPGLFNASSGNSHRTVPGSICRTRWAGPR